MAASKKKNVLKLILTTYQNKQKITLIGQTIKQRKSKLIYN